MFQDALTIAARIQAARQRCDQPEMFRLQIRNTLAAAELAGLENGYTADDMRMAVHATAALLDETIVLSRGPQYADLRRAWYEKPLQEELFGTRIAAAIFFRNLDTLLKWPDSPVAADLLELYRLCLLLGFRGCYANEREMLNRLLRRSGEKLCRVRKLCTLPPSRWPATSPSLEVVPPKSGLAAGRLDTQPVVLVLGEAPPDQRKLLAETGLELEAFTTELASGEITTLDLKREDQLRFLSSGETVLIDASYAALACEESRHALVRKLSPRGLHTLFRKQRPARAAVLLLDCDTLLAEGAAELLARQAEQARGALEALAAELNTNIPVYVLFDKAGVIQYFPEFARRLNGLEARAIFGAKMDRQSLPDAFETLYRELISQRDELLLREEHLAARPNIFEFPREFARLRPLVIEYLNSLRGEDSRLELRGFYFSGIAAIEGGASAPARVWLRRLFPDVILAETRSGCTVPPRKPVKSTAARMALRGKYLNIEQAM